jgi:hypothetical protein
MHPACSIHNYVVPRGGVEIGQILQIASGVKSGVPVKKCLGPQFYPVAYNRGG